MSEANSAETAETSAIPAASETTNLPIDVEDQYHHYSGNRIPWYVRLMWLGFWVLAIAYSIRLLFPAVQEELLAP